MPLTCAVIDCLKTRTDSVSLFTVANHEKSLHYQAFLEKANANYSGHWRLNKTTSVCSDHFDKCVLEVLPSKRLRPHKNAVPTLLNGKEIISKEELDICVLSSQKNDFEFVSNSTDEFGGEKDQLLKEKSNYIEELLLTIKAKDKLIQSLKNDLQRKSELVDRYQKTIRLFEQKEKRKAKSLKRKAQKAENYVPPKKVAKINRMDENTLNILEELVSRGDKSKAAPFSESLREFAFEIHYYSPRAYEKLRDKIVTLPNPSSFQNWTRHINVKPGFLQNSFDFISRRISESPHKLYYALSVDEVYIRKQIVPNKNSFIGYVDYGNMADAVYTSTEASAALFVMATEINGHHKIPLGYVLTNGLKQKVLKKILRRTLDRMKTVNANVLTITFDGLPANTKAAELLGANMNVLSENFQPYIKGSSPDQNIYFILDASHMIKLFRNLFKEYKTLINHNGEEICWQYIVKLIDLQQAEGLRAGNKLTARHINFDGQKMKTKLAVQTLSGSSAIALRFARFIRIPGFESTRATEEFLSTLNQLFDYMNSVTKGIGAKAPLRWANYEEISCIFSNAKNYLLSLKWRHVRRGKLVETPLIKTQRATAVKGIIITMTNLEMIMINILADPNSDLKFLPTCKVSQDPLENFFSSLRSRFGFNNNPNALQLQHALKGMMCMKTKALETGNCVEQEETSTKISHLQSVKTIIEDDPVLEEEEADEILDFDIDVSQLSLYGSNVAFYISGFVASKLLKKLHCPGCIMKLYPSEEDLPKIASDCTLTLFRDKGGLFYSSFWLLSICKITEQIIKVGGTGGLRKLNKQAVISKVVHECFENGLVVESHDCTCSESKSSFNGGHCLQLIKQIAFHYSTSRFSLLARNATLQIRPTTNRNSCTFLVNASGN